MGPFLKHCKKQTYQSFLSVPGFFILDDGLCVSLNADGQRSLTPHTPQRGLRGVHIVCPNPTYLVQISTQKMQC